MTADEGRSSQVRLFATDGLVRERGLRLEIPDCDEWVALVGAGSTGRGIAGG